MIGRLTTIDPEPQRSVKMTFSVDQVSCEIASPPGPVSCRDVTAFEIKKWPLGAAAVLCVVLACAVLAARAIRAVDALELTLSLGGLLGMVLIGFMVRKVELYRVYLLTVIPDRERVRFYSTFSKFDVFLLMDSLEFWIGSRPRKLT